MDIDVIGEAISQSTIQQPLDIGTVAYVAERIDAHVVGIVGAHRHQPVPHNLRNDVRPLEPLAGLGVKEYRAWCPKDTYLLRQKKGLLMQAPNSEGSQSLADQVQAAGVAVHTTLTRFMILRSVKGEAPCCLISGLSL